MIIPPAYSITNEMLACINQIEAKRIYFSSLSLPNPLKEKIQRISLLKSSLFSARIEGNPLELSDLEDKQTKNDAKLEIFNIIEAVDFLSKQQTEIITKDLLVKLHALVLKNLSPYAGYFRKEVSAIFNQAGVAIYMPPPPTEIPILTDKLLAYSNLDQEKFPLVSAFISHLIFEKIHPFLDGNGRVGRLLISAILKTKGWDITFAVPFEEYLDNHKDEYYYYLDTGMRNTNEYLIFMLDAFLNQIQQLQKQIEIELEKKENPFLPPRQDEIYNIIKDHVVVSFDTIHRRFLSVPSRTLRYDLKKLVDLGLIEKSGETKGRYYRAKKF